jgi:hypothetical protein
MIPEEMGKLKRHTDKYCVQNNHGHTLEDLPLAAMRTAL